MATHPDVQAAMDAAISPAARALLVELLRIPRRLTEHEALYREVQADTAFVIRRRWLAAVADGQPLLSVDLAAEFAIAEVFEQALVGTPSEIKRTADNTATGISDGINSDAKSTT